MKRLLFTLVLIAIVFGGVSLALRFEKKETLKSDPRKPAGTAEVTALLTLDTDGDGLKDWEEDLWGTDKEKADTDDDGTNDGDEIRERRNPLTPGPDDLLDEASIKEKTTLDNKTGPETDTDRLAKEFFATYMEVKKDGGNLTPESIEAFSEKLYASSPDLKAPVYTEKDLIVGPSSDSTAIRTYGNTVGAIIASVPAPQENELDVLRRASETRDEIAILNLDPIIEGYTKLLADLKAVPVPKGAEDGHLLLLQSIDGIRTSVVNMRQLFQNPVVVLPAFSLHQESTESLIDSFRILDAYFISHGVTFKEGEGGYLISSLSV